MKDELEGVDGSVIGHRAPVICRDRLSRVLPAKTINLELSTASVIRGL